MISFSPHPKKSIKLRKNVLFGKKLICKKFPNMFSWENNWYTFICIVCLCGWVCIHYNPSKCFSNSRHRTKCLAFFSPLSENILCLAPGCNPIRGEITAIKLIEMVFSQTGYGTGGGGGPFWSEAGKIKGGEGGCGRQRQFCAAFIFLFFRESFSSCNCCAPRAVRWAIAVPPRCRQVREREREREREGAREEER